MPFCPTCKGSGKKTQCQECGDCNGRRTVTDNMLEFIQFYNQKKEIEKTVASLENDEAFIEQYEEALKE